MSEKAVGKTFEVQIRVKKRSAREYGIEFWEGLVSGMKNWRFDKEIKVTMEPAKLLRRR